jgi:hypothetical protein
MKSLLQVQEFGLANSDEAEVNQFRAASKAVNLGYAHCLCDIETFDQFRTRQFIT